MKEMLILALLIGAPPVLANWGGDAGGSVGTGTFRATGTDQVEMQNENLEIRLFRDRANVQVSYVLKNTGPAVDVKAGFPCLGLASIKRSADAKYGADCAHFIIYGKRRQGVAIPYVNPKGLLRYLQEIDQLQGFKNGAAWGRRGPIEVSTAQINDGVLLHFGNHVAAIYEAGPLRESTRVVHQLEKFPEITTLGALARRYQKVRIMIFRS